MTFAPLTRRTLLTGAAALAMPSLLAACDQRAPIDEQGRIRLRLAAPGPARADYGGFYQAIANGAFSRRNLNVQISHGNSAEDVSRHLAAGTAELGLGQDSFAALRLVAERAPVKAVAAFFQKDPRVLIAHVPNGPRTLSDIGERVLFIDDGNWPDIWQWLHTRYDLQSEQLQRPDGGGLAPFLEDPDSLLIGTLSREPALVAGTAPEIETRLLLPADDGYASYSNLLLAPNAFARDNAVALRDFIAAAIEGWTDYMNGNPEPAHTLIRRANPATQQGSLDIARELLKANSIVQGSGEDKVTIGTMSKERWMTFAEQASPSFSPQPDWTDAYTTGFLPSGG